MVRKDDEGGGLLAKRVFLCTKVDISNGCLRARERGSECVCVKRNT